MLREEDHVIHLVDGHLSPKSKTSNKDVAHIVSSALKAGKPSGIVVHFHGGLVSETSARTSIREQLYPLYCDEADAYPVFFVWESGFFEAPLNNIKEIANEDLFQEFVKKAAEWVFKKLPSGVGLKGGSGASINEAKLRSEFDEWFSGQRQTLPDYVLPKPGLNEADISVKAKGVEVEPEDLEAEIAESIEGDNDFKDALEAVYNGLHADGEPLPATKGAGTSISSKSHISKEAADRLFERPSGKTKGFGPISWFRVAKTVAAIVIRVIRRFRKGRAHGPYVTLVEEVLRELYIDKIGRLGWWDLMKGDTADAFRSGNEFGGTVFLAELKEQLASHTPPPKITLVGHSTGAIYICNLLQAAAQWLPSLQFDVIFEAPAATHDLLAATVAAHGSRIRNFRQFGMSDDREAGDQMVPIIYPSSLLYFVSGLLESEPDEPLVGMARYLDRTDVYDIDSFPNIEAVRQFYANYAESLVWSPSSAGSGRNSDGKHHGDFDDQDGPTKDSVAHILKNGF